MNSRRTGQWSAMALPGKNLLVSRLFAFPLVLSLLFSARAAHAAEAVALPQFRQQDVLLIWIVFLSGLLSVFMGWYWYRSVASQSPGTSRMEEVGRAIRDGALAYLQQQIKAMLLLVVIIAIGLFLLYRGQEALGYGIREAIGVAIFFIAGVAASYIAGYVGMGMATIGNQRTANQARTTFKGALETAFRAGAVSGMMTVGLGLIGACLVFLIYREKAMLILVGFGFGGSLAALFMRVGGGIFTKAADVGADLVGKVEAGIPEDDPRNPATIADNVGDNVGDCAGMAADVFESYEVTLVAAIILGAAVIPMTQWQTNVLLRDSALQLVMYPLIVRAVGVLASIIGVFAVKGQDREDLDPMQPINQGFRVSAILAVILFGVGSYLWFGRGVEIPLPDGSGNQIYEWWRFFLCTFVGIVLAVVIGALTEYFTSTQKKPVTEVAYNSKTGPATMIISGFSYGLESSVWSVVAICLTILAALLVFAGNTLLAAYGIALAGLGLLTTTGYILAMDTFGPITDNANGIFEMSGVLEEDRASGQTVAAGGLSGDRIVGRLDAVGNTTKALTKGFAIATAVIAAVALFRSFMTDANLLPPTETAQWSSMASELGRGKIVGIPLDVPEVFIGLLIGGAAPFLFSAFSINAVGRAAFHLIEEVRRQFREDPGIMAGTSRPNYARCVAIVTAAAQKELIGPGILAIALPILVGFGLGFRRPDVGAAALGGYLAGAIISGQLMAVLLSNSGGAWDNAKKKIEDGLFGGKGTEYHKAGVICDTVGDPFKDTAGPALNPLIKVMNLTGILIAGVVIQDIPVTARLLVVIIAVAFLAGAIFWSKRGSIVDQMPTMDTLTPGSPKPEIASGQ
ncbi:MAG: sodium-translocating pyrophosphatase [Chloroherpetonaceae bacterium]|nr:sodium-translocating pyrophosphatase [Chthonomonadaceae bacterium]MDW8208174.1 sodium-translocating pyrophosphatase [Chloroherpetonaceae bacterium]